MNAPIGRTDPAKVWGVAAAKAIAVGAPVPVIATWLDHGLTPEPGLFMSAAQAHCADVLTLLFNAAKPLGQAVIDAGVLFALSSLHENALDDLDVARVVLAHASPALLNGAQDDEDPPIGYRTTQPSDIAAMWGPVWFSAYANTNDRHDAQHLTAVLTLLRDHEADLNIVETEPLWSTPWGNRRGDALHAFLNAERVEHEQAELRQAADEAMAAGRTAQAITRRRL
ncbi:hypothetical protein QZM81_19375 [Burkholderia cepacia]|uniref:hypothetical protein n=1 Tax=Burkholderia cepacia TaxID=292 RepID=UPI0026547144|nr:hypothetical protein [Burkholderia cepacia]MDN7857968.1 hypothetical protein [Burkholderia cepacia]